MSRLPPTRYADEVSSPPRSATTTTTNTAAAPSSGGTAGRRGDRARIEDLVPPPPLESYPSSSSIGGSTRYSPLSDSSPVYGSGSSLGASQGQQQGNAYGHYLQGSSLQHATTAMSDTTLLSKDSHAPAYPAATAAGNGSVGSTNQPGGVTWAPTSTSSTPGGGGNNSSSRPTAFPTLSYGAGGVVHPGAAGNGNQDGFYPSGYSGGAESQQHLSTSGANVKRGRSLVRPERERIDENSRFFNYRQHAAVYEAENTGRVGHSGPTGYPNHLPTLAMPYGGGQGGIAAVGLLPGVDGRPNLRRGKSILAREEGMANDSGLNFLKRGATLRRKMSAKHQDSSTAEELLKGKKDSKTVAKAPLSWWMIYCYVVTFFLPGVFLAKLGYTSLDRRRAFREKIGLLSVVMALMAAVGFLTFGFTDAVCNNSGSRYRTGTVQGGSMIFHGYDYAMDTFEHPAAPGITTGSNPLYSDFNAGSKDGSFMFQNVNQNCKGIITLAQGSKIPYDASTGNLGWYFPCNLYDQYGTTTVNKTGYIEGQLCHTQSSARTLFAQGENRNVSNGFKRQGPVYYTWDDIKNSSRNLGVYKSSVLDFSLLNWLDSQYVSYPAVFTQLAQRNTTFDGRDSTMQLLISGNRTLAECLDDIIRVGFVDSKTMGCIVADIVLYVSLVFILAVVGIKFGMAVVFSWFWGRRMGSFRKETNADRMKRMAEVEAWTNDIYRPAPAKYRPNVKNARKSYLPTTSRFTQHARPYSTFGEINKRQSVYPARSGAGLKGSPPDTPVRTSKSNTSLPLSSHFGRDSHSRASSFDLVDSLGRPCPFPLDNVIAQPTPDYQPFSFPLAHTILLVTAYSESVEGLRTTLDSLATTDYPNSHKMILVVCDGMVKGSGNTLATPDIVLTMMKELVTPREEVEPHSYVAVADGHKRHNMAKVYAGFYDYDDETVEMSKQQRVPIVLVAKCGNPLEAHDPKPGNRGKRDSQVLLMAFLQKVMFDERMTSFEYEFFNSIWRVSGISADNYEHVLMVDADTKVFPDSLTRMVACMVQDNDIMGLCGETKIANKKETWVTMIQVFEYYISHHQTKAFESMWGGVTCLPGCFSMYRIKAPKGPDGYWVPILANPDIVEHYSENVVDTLHKKNLLLLGEDRYLSTLMLKTFPKRKMMFCPQAYCKTVVPDTFRVLLSQRRRWINSTIHNLFELLLVRDLCGTFCFSMQFVVFMELVGTLVLPAAIAFTIYVLVITCIPSKPKPVIPLILLACILGLPGILIVVTSRKIAYVGWMLIYLLSLPIWNAVLPAYAYFHMDDFSWGSTRKVEGEGKGGSHGDKDGEFDSNAIAMKRWSEWERERRWKSGTRSRDSTFENFSAMYQQHQHQHFANGGHPRSGSPHTNRTSTISTTDTYVSGPQLAGPAYLHHHGAASQISVPTSAQDPFSSRHSGVHSSGFSTPSAAAPGRRAVDNVQVIEMPAPLSAATSPSPQAPMQPFHRAASSTDVYEIGDPGSLHNYEASPYQSSSSEGFHQTRADDEYPRSPQGEAYDSDSAEKEAILPEGARSPNNQPAAASAHSQPRTAASSSRRSDSHVANTAAHQRKPSLPPSASQRGVSLYDPGPVSAPDGAVRIVTRNRRASQGRARQSIGGDRDSTLASPIDMHTSPTIQSPTASSLPPGAAPRKDKR